MREEKQKRKKGPGRPSLSGKFQSSKCDVRLTAKEESMLRELSERNNVTKSTIMRKALRDFYLFNSEGGSKDYE